MIIFFKKSCIFIFILVTVFGLVFSNNQAVEVEASGQSFAEDLVNETYNSPDSFNLFNYIPRDLLNVPGFHMDIVGDKGYMIYNRVIYPDIHAAPDIQSTIQEFRVTHSTLENEGTISVFPGNKYVFYVWPKEKVLSYDYSETDYYNDFGYLPFVLAPHYYSNTNGPVYPYYSEIHLALSSDIRFGLEMKNANGLNPGEIGYTINNDNGLYLTETYQHQINSKIIFNDGNYAEPIITSFAFGELTSVFGDLLEGYEIVEDFDEIMSYYEIAKDMYDLGQYIANNPIFIQDDLGNVTEFTPAMAEEYDLDYETVLALQQYAYANTDSPDFSDLAKSVIKLALDKLLYEIPGIKYLWLAMDLSTQSYYPDYLTFVPDAGHIYLDKNIYNQNQRARVAIPENIVNDNSKILIAEKSFARFKYKTAHSGDQSFKMDIKANVQLTGGYIDSVSSQQFVPQKTINVKLDLTQNRYMGELTRGLTFYNNLNDLSEKQFYKVVPNFTGEITFDTFNELDYVNIKLYNAQGVEVPLYYRSQTNTMYGYVTYGQTYYAMIENSPAHVYDMLTLRFYRTNPFTGYVYLPAHVEGYGENQIWYEYSTTTSKTVYFSHTNSGNADISIKIYDSNFVLLKSTSTLSELGYYFIANRKYYIIFEGKSIFGDDSYFDFVFNMRLKTGSC